MINHDLLQPMDFNLMSYYFLLCVEYNIAANIARLPFILKILLESVLRNCDVKLIHQDDEVDLANWQPQGVKAVIAESYERIHRSNLIGMGILPLQFVSGDSVTRLKLNDTEIFSIENTEATEPKQEILVSATTDNGTTTHFKTLSRIDTPIEIQYYRDSGILRTVLKKLLP